jgi:hypothetical protein
MTRRLSLMIAWGCRALLALLPVAALYGLLNIEAFAGLARDQWALPVQWDTVGTAQWYALWGLIVLYLSLGAVGLYFLQRAFTNFAAGELFNAANSRDLKRFSGLLLIQACATPLYFALASLLLSLHHPAGEQFLSLSFGSNELKAIVVGLVLWVLSDLLVEGGRLQHENRQFV